MTKHLIRKLIISLNTLGDTKITKINSKSIQPIIELGTNYALWGLKRPQKTVVRLKLIISSLPAIFTLDCKFIPSDEIFEPTCAACDTASLSVCPDHRGVVGFLVRSSNHLLATFWFCWLLQACWLHCVFSMGLLAYQANKKTKQQKTQTLLDKKYQTSGIARHIFNGL